MNRLRDLISFLLLVGLAACSYPITSYPGFNIRLTDPNSSSYLWPVGQPLALGALADVEGGGASSIVFYANAGSVGSVPVDPTDVNPTASFDWTPTAAGEYFVQAEISRPSGSTRQSAFSPTVRVCVLDLGPQRLYDLWGYGYSGPCTLPPLHASPSGTSQVVTIHATAMPTSLAYFTSACTGPVGADTVVHFSATVNDPAGLVAFVTIGMSLMGGSPFHDALVLNQTGGGPAGVRTYSGSTVNMNSAFMAALGGAHGTLSWEARAFDRSALIIAFENHTMLVGPCVPPARPDVIMPSATPASALDCPSGTYFAEVTHQCLAVAAPTPGNAGSGGPVACSSYKNSAACTTHGCSWDLKNSVCH